MVAIKKLLVSIILSTLFLNVSAQTTDSLLTNFKNSIVKHLSYPPELIHRCTATSTILKISVDAKGEVIDMNLSDSADPLFVIEWLSKLKAMDTASLKKYIKLKGIKNANVLLPICYTFKSNTCNTVNIDPDNAIHLYEFEKKNLTGASYLLPLLNFSLKLRVSH